MSLPIVHLTGTPYAQGVAHGNKLKERIAHNVALYFERFEREVELLPPVVRKMAGQYAGAIEKHNPAYFAGMKGVAEGSGFPLLDIVALNVRYEILYYQFGKMAMAVQANREGQSDGCTAFALLPEATENNHLLMGQNWDWIPDVQGTVLHTTDDDGFETLAYTESGIVGAKIGFNSAGVGLCINGMTTVNDEWARLSKPFHVRCYEILRSRSFDDAVKVVTDEARACAANFLIAQAPGKVADIEAAPDTFGILGCEAGCLTHANHFIDPEKMGVVETPNDRRIYSWRRQARLRELLLARRPLSVEKIQDALRDTQDDPFGICRHRNPAEPPEMHYTTVTSVVMDLDARTLHLTDGPPDEGLYQVVSFAQAG